jgi:hypothetical protein
MAAPLVEAATPRSHQLAPSFTPQMPIISVDALRHQKTRWLSSAGFLNG